MYQVKWDRNKLINYYQKQFKKLKKSQSISSTKILDQFILNLKFLRDLYIIDLSIDIKKNFNFSTLQAALTEYTLYENCILNYYHIIKQPEKPLTVEPIDSKKTKEEVLLEYQKERTTHWARFWTLVSTYIEDWGADEFTL